MSRQKTQDKLQSLLANHMHKIPQAVWDRMTAQERVEELTGHSLDNCRAILDLPLEMAVMSPTVMTGKVQVVRAILTAVTKVGIESSRLRTMQDEVLGSLIDEFDREEAKAGGSLSLRSTEQSPRGGLADEKRRG